VPDEIISKYFFTESEMVKSLRLHWRYNNRHSRLISLLVFGLVAFFLGIRLFDRSTSWGDWFGYCICLAFFFLILYGSRHLVVHFAKRSFRKSTEYNREVTWIFSDSGLVFRGPKSDVPLGWDSIKLVTEVSEGFLVHDSVNYYWFPYHSLGGDDRIAPLRSLFSSKVADFKSYR
jgi:hypothetical protein